MNKRASPNPHIRWMIRRDMPEVMQIERASFGEDAWPEEEFLRCLRQRNCIGMVAETRGPEGESVAGYMLYELQKRRLDVLKLAVAPEFRGLGFGRALVERLVSKLSSHRRVSLRIDVPERLLDAQLFLRACGFSATKVLRVDEQDLFRMAYRLTEEVAA